MTDSPAVLVAMGSQSDWPTMKLACNVLEEFHVPYEARIISAHRTPHRTHEWGMHAHKRGFQVIIAGAGGAAHLPGVLASLTPLPVIGVPIKSSALSGVDSVWSILQMPAGIPVATMAIGDAGARNAGIFALQILAAFDLELLGYIAQYKAELAKSVDEFPKD